MIKIATIKTITHSIGPEVLMTGGTGFGITMISGSIVFNRPNLFDTSKLIDTLSITDWFQLAI